MSKHDEPGRAQQTQSFLDGTEWRNAMVAPLAGDASNRRYLRLSGQAGPAVLMDAPPDRGEDTQPFIAMTEWLRALGLSAPAILATDPVQGFLLLEDLGDALYARCVADAPNLEKDLYAAAVRLLAKLSEHAPPSGLAPYDAAVLDREAHLFTEWWLPAATGSTTTDVITQTFLNLVAQATSDVSTSRDIVVLRDYHAENLLWLPEREGHARIGLLDYQDALLGHPAYDLVSLLEDARRDTTPELREEMLLLYLSERPELDPAEFRAAYACLGAQRNLKIIGIFARLALRDRKPRYLTLIPRVWEHLRRDMEHPSLAALRDWVLAHSPEPTPALLARIAEETTP